LVNKRTKISQYYLLYIHLQRCFPAILDTDVDGIDGNSSWLVRKSNRRIEILLPLISLDFGKLMLSQQLTEK
jgi:hypothetical protein